MHKLQKNNYNYSDLIKKLKFVKDFSLDFYKQKDVRTSIMIKSNLPVDFHV